MARHVEHKHVEIVLVHKRIGRRRQLVVLAVVERPEQVHAQHRVNVRALQQQLEQRARCRVHPLQAAHQARHAGAEKLVGRVFAGCGGKCQDLRGGCVRGWV